MIDDFPNLTSVTTLCFPVSSKVKKIMEYVSTTLTLTA